ncbi:MAG: hypothetical protein Q8P12_04215, partial [bacterium]|nr:hypothetical protein [bacterium]
IDSLLSKLDQTESRVKFAGPARENAIQRQQLLAEQVTKILRPGDTLIDRLGLPIGKVQEIGKTDITFTPDEANPEGVSLPLKDLVSQFIPTNGARSSVQTQEAKNAGTVRSYSEPSSTPLEKNVQGQAPQEPGTELQLKAAVDEEANEAATSPLNKTPEPTQAQIEAGNFKHGHTNIQGLDISIENPAGSVRKGVDENGKTWERPIANHYGYIRKSEGKDGEQVDTFLGPNPESDKAFIIDQKDPKTGKFDEHKTLIGFDSLDDARAGYLANYDKTGPSRIMGITEMPMEQLKEWLKGDTTKRVSAPAQVNWKSRKSMGMNIYTAPMEGDTLIIRENPSGKNRYAVYKESDGPEKNIGKFSTLEAAKEAGETIIPRMPLTDEQAAVTTENPPSRIAAAMAGADLNLTSSGQSLPSIAAPEKTEEGQPLKDSPELAPSPLPGAGAKTETAKEREARTAKSLHETVGDFVDKISPEHNALIERLKAEG